MIRYAYNTQLRPPAPFVLVTLQHPLSNAQMVDVPAQLDPAADRTLLPLAAVRTLGLPAIGTMPIGGVGGTVATMSLYPVQIAIHTLPAQVVEVVAHADEQWVLLGRDVLNDHRVLLDGPRLALELG